MLLFCTYVCCYCIIILYIGPTGQYGNQASAVRPYYLIMEIIQVFHIIIWLCIIIMYQVGGLRCRQFGPRNPIPYTSIVGISAVSFGEREAIPDVRSGRVCDVYSVPGKLYSWNPWCIILSWACPEILHISLSPTNYMCTRCIYGGWGGVSS